MKIIHQALHPREASAEGLRGAVAIAHRQGDVGDARPSVAGLDGDTLPTIALDLLKQKRATCGVNNKVAGKLKDNDFDTGAVNVIKTERR